MDEVCSDFEVLLMQEREERVGPAGGALDYYPIKRDSYLPPSPCCNSSFLFHFQSSILLFKCLNLLPFLLDFPSLYFHLKRIRLPSHNVSIYPQGSSAAITVSFGNYKFKVQLCCKSLLERDSAIEKSL